MKVFITGGSGFIGNQVVRDLLALGHEVTTTAFPDENQVAIGCRITYDLSDSSNQDIIVHLAANNDTQCTDAEKMWEANFSYSKKLYENATSAKQFIFASSTAVYGDSPAPYFEHTTKTNPLNVYAESKLAFENWIMGTSKPDLTVVGLRFCNVYGPGEDHKGSRMSMIGQLIRRALRNENFRLFPDGHQKRDWIHVKDVSALICNTLGSPVSGIYNVGTGASTSFLELVDAIEYSLGFRLDVEFIDNPVKDKYQSHTECNIGKAKRDFGFNPSISVLEGIESYINYIKTKASR